MSNFNVVDGNGMPLGTIIRGPLQDNEGWRFASDEEKQAWFAEMDSLMYEDGKQS